MKTIDKISEKQIYSRPEIVCIELDNEISLSLQSDPPIGPDEGLGINISELFTNIPKGLI